MRASLSVVLLLVCLALWVSGLLLGRPWPVELRLGLPPRLDVLPVPVPDPVPSPASAASHRRGFTPPGHAPSVRQDLPCVPASLSVALRGLGGSQGLEAIGMGWPGREEGYGVLPRQAPGGTFRVDGRGLQPPAALLLTAYGGRFDGSGTVEVTIQCTD